MTNQEVKTTEKGNRNVAESVNLPAVDGVALASEIVAAFVEGGRSKPVLPEGRNDEYRAQLTRMMVRRDQLGEYIEALNAARHRHGVDDLLRQLPVAERQVEAIAAQGLEILSAEELADLAIRPNALECLHEFINEMLSAGEAGPSWWRAIEQENQRIPDDYLPPASVHRMIARLKGD